MSRVNYYNYFLLSGLLFYAQKCSFVLQSAEGGVFPTTKIAPDLEALTASFLSSSARQTKAWTSRSTSGFITMLETSRKLHFVAVIRRAFCVEPHSLRYFNAKVSDLPLQSSSWEPHENDPAIKRQKS